MGPAHSTQENTNTYTGNNHNTAMYTWNYSWLRESAPTQFRNSAPPNGHIFYDETLNISQIYLGGVWKTIKTEP
ncbi:hypothetical protein [Chryseobacterium sp.]|uniref:hypothetical protein n=1 Tax=Chryseobacterium sp. TaxID=1871047 RepID=UPI0025BB04A3|nr:hypothetical protein [Chryseobacterium sp.]MBV8324921.1 hypothetical protein [Chryseobacterium sp.]